MGDLECTGFDPWGPPRGTSDRVGFFKKLATIRRLIVIHDRIHLAESFFSKFNRVECGFNIGMDHLVRRLSALLLNRSEQIAVIRTVAG